MRGIAGKAVVVTGGANGIGEATCAEFARHGARVVVADIDGENGVRVAHSLPASAEARFVRTDVADEGSVREMARAVDDFFGGADILVNGAAVFIMKGVEATVEEWRRVLDVNVMGYALTVKHLLPGMKTKGSGAIVNIASISSFIAQPGYLTYNASKAAVAAMTRCMALDVAVHGIRVNAVCPGTVWTKGNERHIRAAYGLDRAGADAHPEIGGAHILGRTADPAEIASTIVFLASDEASFMTGSHLLVDGGYTAV